MKPPPMHELKVCWIVGQRSRVVGFERVATPVSTSKNHGVERMAVTEMIGLGSPIA